MKINRPKAQRIPDHAKRVFKGVIFDVYQWEQELYDGTTATFERLRRPNTAVVFAVLPDGQILLAEQEQPGSEPYLGAIAGRAEPNEDVFATAHRELLEETGYEAKELVLWDERQPANKVDWTVYTFIAKGLAKTSYQKLDAGEKIKLKPVTFDELVDVGASEDFEEKEVRIKFLEAKYDPAKREELRKLFDPSL